MPSRAQTPAAATSANAPEEFVIPDTVELIADVEYSRPDGVPLLMDIYRPKAPAARPRPLVVWIHGGGFQKGSKSRPPLLPLVEQGFIGASINYRLTDVAPFPAQIEDCKTAIRFLRANAARYNIDPDHIGVWGSSAGGYLVALLGVTGDTNKFDGLRYGYADVGSEVQAVVDLSGSHDLPGMRAGFNASIDEALRAFLSGSVAERHELAVAASPMTYVKKGVAPFLMYHGARDNAVQVEQSRDFYQRLIAAGVDATYHEIPMAGHGLGDYPRDRYIREVTEFFEKHLGVPPRAEPERAQP